MLSGTAAVVSLAAVPAGRRGGIRPRMQPVAHIVGLSISANLQQALYFCDQYQVRLM